MTTSDRNSLALSSEINVTPMIDVLLVLLIVFMVIVPAIPRGESVLVPRPAGFGQDPLQPVVLEVLRGIGGSVGFRVNQQDVARQELPSRLAGIYANRAERVLFVRADGDLSFTEVAQAIDLGRAAGADRVGVMTPGSQPAHFGN